MDQAGRERGVLGVDADGAARMALFGPDAALPLVNLAASPQGGATLQLGDSQVPRAVVLKAEPGGARDHRLMPGDKTAGSGWRCRRTARRPSICMIKATA